MPEYAMKTSDYLVHPGQPFSLHQIQSDDRGGLDKAEATGTLMPANIERLRALQERLYAANDWAVLVVIQAMDTAGKDGLIKHVMSGLNPAGCQVTAFKQPSSEELDHDYLWRINRALPRRGEIGIFNRSHYEEVIIARVHDLVAHQQLPPELVTPEIWQQRFRQIRDYERYLAENGVRIIKLFLHISRNEQRERLLDRIEQPDKHWKFSSGDVEERQYWDQYQRAYEQMLQETSTQHAPWYCIPADRKWFARTLTSTLLVELLEAIDPQYPSLNAEQVAALETCRTLLLEEPGAPPYVPESERKAREAAKAEKTRLDEADKAEAKEKKKKKSKKDK